MTQGKIPSLHVAASQYPAEERFDRWAAGVSGSFDVARPTDAAASQFDYQGSWWRYGPLMIARIRFGAHLATRNERHLRFDQLDHYRLILKTEGATQCDSNGRRQRIEAGGLLLQDMSQPEALDHHEGENLVLYLPRESLDEALPRVFDLHGATPASVTAAMLGAHMKLLVAQADDISAEQAPSLARATLSLVAASLMPSRSTLEHARPVIEATVLRQMCRYIELHLGEEQLSAEQLIASFKLSRSSLYRMFEPLGGVSNFIRERRLARAHAELEAAASRIHIGRLADNHGFRSATHFSRAFRQQYGYSPLEVGSKGPVTGPGGKPRGADALEFKAWLRALRD